MSFGQKGGLLFAFLNVLQLVGWTAIMIYDGALAIGRHLQRRTLDLVSGDRRAHHRVDRWWALPIWGCINKISMAALFLLTLVLCKVIFFSGSVRWAAIWARP